MSTIALTNIIETGMLDMTKAHSVACTKVLSEKYGFDLDEALRHLALDKTKITKVKAAAVTKDKPEPKEKATKEKKPKKERDPNKPKRAATGYLLFSADMRPFLREELEASIHYPEKLAPQDVVKGLAARWKELNPEERDEWNQKAKDLASSSESE